jgi:hypothetical protein
LAEDPVGLGRDEVRALFAMSPSDARAQLAELSSRSRPTCGPAPAKK